MKLSELMKDIELKPDFTGFVTNDDMVLAINTGGETVTDEKDFEVLQMGVAGLDSQMNPITQDKIYIRAGQSTTKTGDQRTFAVTGDRYVGDPAQDYCLSPSIKYGAGQSVIIDYVYFNIITGKGEKGQASIIVNSDGSGNAGENASFDISLRKSGSKAVEYTYTASAQQSSPAGGGNKPSSL